MTPTQPMEPQPTGAFKINNDQKPTLFGPGNKMTESIQQEKPKQAGNSCVFCSRKTHHKYQLYCPALKSMQPDDVGKIMKKNGITCQMCLCPGHGTRDCESTNNGILKKCFIKDDQDNVCGKFHCRFLHRAQKKEEQSTEHKESKPINQPENSEPSNSIEEKEE